MKINKFAATFLATTFVLSGVNYVSAQEMSQEQELEQKVEVKCEVGAYGQDSSCDVEAYQKGIQKQTITLSDGTVVRPHTPVDAALDMKTSAVAAGLIAVGLLAITIRRKLV